ncbi:Stk1 family PASTA domain-containing Ser/Thr kinase [Clostridium sp.]|uniref:Stk1 family PASTA domain-containing Ser/Thr kinase n=1 Tax=Clostridium sp. TaxID=1506 RepID=UPI002616A20B|nr:Stk1 family PASTA domain-containing Ser/Thr kinase [Clostridium sp.]
MIGLTLSGRYELLEKVGEGGMSEVYKARCNKLNRYVAVKILKKQFADNEEISQKFKREATAIANLSDANIVNVLDVGNQDDIDYIVMEYIDGKTLKELIKFKGKLSFNTTINIALQIAKALDCAHKNNIIHRDIKPQNILVTESGEIKVTDFGIAKSVDSQTIINTTSVIGSAHYLSPEQAKGSYIDFRSDIYSFGIVIYEMVTGTLPFEGDSPVSVALKHLQEKPLAPKNINTSIPDSLNKLILKAMEKETINRYQNIKEMIQDLNKIKDNPDVIIGRVQEGDQSTIIMSPIKQDSKINSKDSSYEEEYDDDYDEEDDDDDYDDVEYLKKKKTKNKNKNSKKKIFMVVGIIIGVLLLGSIGFALASGGTLNKEVQIPSNIVGMNINEAKKDLEGLGIKVEVSGTEISDKEENTILKIDPKEGTKVKKGSSVKVVISGGEETFKMDDFKDYEKTSIDQILGGKGFTNYTIDEEYSDNVKEGYWIRQSPKAKTEIKKDTEIKVIVSKGPEVKLVDVPSVLNKGENEGKNILEEKRLKVEVNYQTTHNKDEDGIILNQSMSGNKVEEGTPVTITVGKFEEKEIDISRLGVAVGQSLFEAKARIDAQGLEVKIEGPKDDDAIVISFTEKVKEGEIVTLKTKKDNPPKQDKPKPTE